jgi:hypothetical protein
VNQNLCQGLGHGLSMRKKRVRFNPFRVDGGFNSVTQGSSFLATLG